MAIANQYTKVQDFYRRIARCFDLSIEAFVLVRSDGEPIPDFPESDLTWLKSAGITDGNVLTVELRPNPKSPEVYFTFPTRELHNIGFISQIFAEV
jgi:hypothetical protein